jgi:hypothetical protein
LLQKPGPEDQQKTQQKQNNESNPPKPKSGDDQPTRTTSQPAVPALYSRPLPSNPCPACPAAAGSIKKASSPNSQATQYDNLDNTRKPFSSAANAAPAVALVRLVGVDSCSETGSIFMWHPSPRFCVWQRIQSNLRTNSASHKKIRDASVSFEPECGPAPNSRNAIHGRDSSSSAAACKNYKHTLQKRETP